MCEDEWEKGFAVEKMSAKDSVNVKRSFNCAVQLQDGMKYVLVELPREDDAYESFVQSIPVYTGIASLPDGLYTWILPTPDTIALTPVYSAIEAGSAHMTLAYRIGATVVYGAGEVMKRGSAVTYNTLSGTYMLKWLSSVPERCHAQLETDVRRAFERLAPGATAINDTMITKDILLAPKDLEWYKSHGFRVVLFDDPKTCVAERDRLKLAIDAEVRAKQKARTVEMLLAAAVKKGKDPESIRKLEEEVTEAKAAVAEASAKVERFQHGAGRHRKTRRRRRSLRFKGLHRTA